MGIAPRAIPFFVREAAKFLPSRKAFFRPQPAGLDKITEIHLAHMEVRFRGALQAEFFRFG